MKTNINVVKSLIKSIGYVPEDGSDDVFYKTYIDHDDYTIKINFQTETIQYRCIKIPEDYGIMMGDGTTSNFKNSENFVVLECVDRLLEKGYKPSNISLEHHFHLGRELKGKLDILVFDNENKPFLMIECKTWGTEYRKEQKKMIKDGGQLFSYYVQDKATKYLCLYTSHLNNNKVEYKNEIVKVDEAWIELSNEKEIHDHWNKNFKDNGIFEEWASAYDIEIKALVRGRLKELTQEDSGRIFNQFAEILRHNIVSDKPNAFNKILNLFICKIIDEDRNEFDQVEFQWLENDTDEDLQARLNDLYKKGMHRFLGIEVTDYSEDDISNKLTNINDKGVLKDIKAMFSKLRLQKNPEFAFMEVYDDYSFRANARVVKEVVELLQPYQFRYGHKQQFLGDFFELLLNTSIKQEAGQYFTPVPITRFIVSSLPIKEFILNKLKSDDPEILPVAIDYATGSGHFLTEYMDQVQNIIENIDISNAIPSARKKINIWRGEDAKFDWAKDYVYGIEADYRLVKTTKVSSFLNGDGEANIIRANGLDNFIKSKDFKLKLKEVSKDDSKDNGQFDILIANPPYSVSAFKSTIQYGEESFELFNRFTDNSSEIECLFIERTKQLLKVGGWAGIILPSSILSNTGIYTAAREFILKYFKIKAIIEFGSNTFMATGTNTVTLFLERRSNNDYKIIVNAINNFFERPKETTILGIEKAFSKYVDHVFDDICLDDYISFVLKKPNDKFKSLEIYWDYSVWFENLTEVKQMKSKKIFKGLSKEEQQMQLDKLFFEKIFEIEKDKILYFMLTCPQKVVIIKVGEKQDEKAFIGYEFSNRRGHEGIKMLPNGTKLYDENNFLNFKKANTYIYKSFLNQGVKIDETMSKNVSITNTAKLIDFSKSIFEKIFNINDKKKLNFKSKWASKKLGVICNIKIGGTPSRNNNLYYKNGIHKWLSISEMHGNIIYDTKEKITDLAIKKSNVKLIKSGTTLLSFKLSIGKTAITGVDLYTNEAIAALEVSDNYKNDVKDKYLFTIFTAKLIDLTSTDFKAFGKSLNSAFLNELLIPLPPINIQMQIINEIETIELKKQHDENKINNLKNNMIKSEYFDYSEERIDKVAIMIQRGKSTKYGNSKIQIIKSGQARGYTEFDFSQRYYVTEKFISDKRNLRKGDILINSTGVGTAGRVTLFDLDGDFVVDSHITIVRLDQTRAVPKYVLYALANIGFKNIEKMATGQSGQIELSLPIINNIKIPLPTIDRQKEIVAEIESIEVKILKMENEIVSTEDIKNEILKKYL